MKETISLEEAYNHGMCREGLKRFIMLIDTDDGFYHSTSIWLKQWYIRSRLDKLTPDENKWLKDHGYLYKQEHEYKFGDKIQIKRITGEWVDARYIRKTDTYIHDILTNANIILKAHQDVIRPAKEATMKDTISLEEAYNAGMCREGLKRFIEIIDGIAPMRWSQRFVINDSRLNKLTPDENKWLKDHGYLYKQEHEYKFGDDVECHGEITESWIQAKYVKPTTEGKHVAYNQKLNVLLLVGRDEIRPAKEA